MSSTPRHGDGPDDDHWPTEEEFQQKLKQDPEFAAWFHGIAKKVTLGEYGELTPQAHESAKKLVAALETERTVAAVQKKLGELMEMADSPPELMDAATQLAECRSRLDELVDLGLELPEPHRTNLLRAMLEIRERIAKLEPPGG